MNLDDEDELSDSTAVIDARDILRAVAAEPSRRHLLIGVRGIQLGRVVAVQGAEFVVGRSTESGLWLNDSGVSRRHAILRQSGKGYVLEDLGSSNGTYVEGEKLGVRKLRDGDVIQFGPEALFRYSLADSQQEAMLHHLYEASVSDALTGASNREHLDQQLKVELSYARRHDVPLSLLMLDIDHFKHINDTYGHQAGDHVLVELVSVVTQQLRAEDILARYGGEEFAVVLRTTTLEEAARVGERIRATIEGMQIEFEGRRIPVTASIGCSSIDCCTEVSEAELVEIADRRLYQAKHSGRNRVVAGG